MGTCSSVKSQSSVISVISDGHESEQGDNKRDRRRAGEIGTQTKTIRNGDIYEKTKHSVREFDNVERQQDIEQFHNERFRFKFKRRPNRLSAEELCRQYKEEARDLRDNILRGDPVYVRDYWYVWKIRDEEDQPKKGPKIDKDDQELIAVIYRFFTKLGRGGSTPPGDPNLKPFPLPDDVNPLDLRDWLCEDYYPFYTGLEDEVAWSCVEPWGLAMGDVHKQFVASLRPWLKFWKPFNTKMGKTSYTSLYIIKDDKPTPEQLSIMKGRSRRDMTDEGRMSRRRKELMNYFQQKYSMSDSDVAKYSDFVQSLKEGQLKLEELCNDHTFKNSGYTEKIIID